SKQEDFNPPGMPKVPSHCAANPQQEYAIPGKPGTYSSGGCEKCYGDAVASLNRVRQNLERLRALGQANKEYFDAEIAYGESIASIPNTGVGWFSARQKIEAGEEEFHQAYDKKYGQLVQSLEKSLREISECERAFFHEEDWYDRFGFIYY